MNLKQEKDRSWKKHHLFFSKNFRKTDKKGDFKKFKLLKILMIKNQLDFFKNINK